MKQAALDMKYLHTITIPYKTQAVRNILSFFFTLNEHFNIDHDFTCCVCYMLHTKINIVEYFHFN